jgi:hypothetical protein
VTTSVSAGLCSRRGRKHLTGFGTGGSIRSLGLSRIWTTSVALASRPFDVALNLEHRFCGAGPATVLVGVESTERKRLSRNSNGWFEMPQILLDSEAARLRRAISKG